jgi:hypothetical protein
MYGYFLFYFWVISVAKKRIIKAVPLQAMVALGGRADLAPTPS